MSISHVFAARNLPAQFLLAMTFSLPLFAQADYYDKPCVEQQSDAYQLASLRDSGLSTRQIEEWILANYPAQDQNVLIGMLPWIMHDAKDLRPLQIKNAARDSCENHGQFKPRAPLTDSSLKSRGTLSTAEYQQCLDLSARIRSDRDDLTRFENELVALESSLSARKATIDRAGSAASNMSIDAYNQEAFQQGALARKYEALGSRYQQETNEFNQRCGGKTPP